MLLKLCLLPLSFLFVCAALAQNTEPIEINSYVLLGKYKLVSGPRDLCDRLSVSEKDFNDPVVIGAHYSFYLSNSTQRFPSEVNPKCESIRRNLVSEKAKGSLVLTYLREEHCGEAKKVEEKTTALLTKGQIQIEKSYAAGKGYTCHWKWRAPTLKEKK